jgi:hypothetical protein
MSPLVRLTTVGSTAGVVTDNLETLFLSVGPNTQNHANTRSINLEKTLLLAQVSLCYNS